MESIFLIAIIVIGTILFVGSLCAHKIEAFFNFVIRLFFGILGIYLINHILAYFHVNSGVGMNGLSFLTVGLLGVPGMMLLYAVAFYYSLK